MPGEQQIPPITQQLIQEMAQGQQLTWQNVGGNTFVVQKKAKVQRDPTLEDPIEMYKGLKRVRPYHRQPPEGFGWCGSCQFYYEDKGVLYWNKGNPDRQFSLCKFCFPKSASCRFCQHVVKPEEYQPGQYVQTYCPYCGPGKNGRLIVPQKENMVAEVEILKKRRGTWPIS